MIIEKLLRMHYNNTKRKYKEAKAEYNRLLKEEAEKAIQAEKEAENQARQEKRKKQLINELQIQSATINHYESQVDYYKGRLLVQTTDKNKLKYSEHIFQIEQRIRKAKAKAEQIENELSGLQ